MPRKKGTVQQGTPGKGYQNRTDLTSNYDNSQNTAATGGMAPPPQSQMAMGPSPDDSPNLSAPTNYPNEPITAGLNIGPGDGSQRDTRLAETQNLQRFIPLLALYLDNEDTPDSVRALFRYIKGS